MTGNDNTAGGTWICNCGKVNTDNFCATCGSPRPAEPVSPPASQVAWVCACGKSNTGKFCVKCGAPRPADETVARQAAEVRAAQEAAARRAAEARAAEEAAARQAAEARAAQEAAARKAAEEAAARQASKAEGSKGMLMKAAIGVAVLLLLIGAYFMFGRKKETPPAPEPPKVETKTETKTNTEKPMDPAVRDAKLKEYAEAAKAANEQRKKDATANEKLVFLVEGVRREGNDLLVSGRFYNGRKNRTIISVKALELDIVLRDVDKELMNEKNIKYKESFTGMNIKPLTDSPLLTVKLPGKAPGGEFNNYTVTAHDVRWEAIGN